MSDGGAGGGAGGEGGAPGGGGGAGGAAAGEGAAGGDDGRRFGAAGSGPLGGRGGAGGYEAVRQASANYFEVHGRNTIVDGTSGDVQVGDRYYARGPQLVSGPVPRDELRRLRLVFEPPPDYDDLLDTLRQQRLVALCGDAGTGRGYAALSLLDAVTHGQAERMDPRTELDRIEGADLHEGHGYVLEIRADDAFVPEERTGHRDGDREAGERAAEGPPAEVHLDRLGALLSRRDAYAVLVADGAAADELLRGRYGRLFLPPPPEGVLRRHLGLLFGTADTAGPEQAVELAARDDVQQALGLDRLRPHEAEELAGRLVRYLKDEATLDELLDECRLFAPRQSAAWFAGSGRPGARKRAAVLASGRRAAFRVALAVYNGSSYSVAAEAAELLAWEYALTLYPERTPGRPLFSDHQQAGLVAARATLGTGEVDYGGEHVPVRTVAFQGRRLSWAVLSHVWGNHHNARGPVCRWLRAQADDGQPMVWIPAAVAAGALCSLDFPFMTSELLLPMAVSESPSQRLAAATALAQAARDETNRPAVRAIVRDWARGEDPQLRSSAALVHGYGTVAGSVPGALDELGPLSGHDDWDLLADSAFSVARLLGRADPAPVIDRIGRWLGDRRADRRDLGLLSVLRMTTDRVRYLWTLHESPVPAGHLDWPLALALCESRPAAAGHVADLVWTGLDTARTREAFLGALAEWARRGERDPGLLDAVCRFLPLLVSGGGDAARLHNLVRRLEKDPDEALAATTVRRLREALPPRGEGRDR